MGANRDQETTAGQVQRASQARNTRIAYEKGWKCFAMFCAEEGIRPAKATADNVVAFLVALNSRASAATGRRLSLATLRIYRSALNCQYRKLGLPSPAASYEVGATLRGLARLREESPRQVRALREDRISAMLEACPQTQHGRRDAAMIALGFAAALRRSELCGLAVADISMERTDGMIVRVRRSKTDQGGVGQRIAVPEGKIVRAISRLSAWLDAVGIRNGYVFQTLGKGGVPTGRPVNPGEVARLVKRYVAKIGLDPADYSAHSLRAGFVTSAAAHRARLDKIMEVTRHRNPATVLGYIRDADCFADHAGAHFL